MEMFFTTTNGTLEGRASHGYRLKANAEKKREEQNAAAENLGIKTRYQVAETDGAKIPAVSGETKDKERQGRRPTLLSNTK